MSTDHAAEFRARQAETWQKSRLWLALMLGGFAWAFFVGDLDSDSPPRLWVAALLSFGVAGLSIVMVTRVWAEHYRCPNCERLILEEGGVPLFPEECSHCHAKLR